MIAYMATNMNSGKRYIGITKQTLDARKAQHKSSAKGGSKLPFHLALHESPNAFSWKEIARCDDRELLFLVEQEAIDKFKTHINYGGYNSTRGGSGIGGFTFSEESKKKLSEAMKARPPRSEETRRKLSEANKGKRPSDACLAAAGSRMRDPIVIAKMLASKAGKFTKTEKFMNCIEGRKRTRLASEVGRTIPLSAYQNILAMRANGKTLKEIGEVYGCTNSAVCYYLKRMKA